MIKMSKPIRLNSLSEKIVVDDAFAKRILGMYKIFTADFSAEVLLYLRRGKEEAAPASGITTVLYNEHIKVYTTVNDNILNPFINRFLRLYHTEEKRKAERMKAEETAEFARRGRLCAEFSARLLKKMRYSMSGAAAATMYDAVVLKRFLSAMLFNFTDTASMTPGSEAALYDGREEAKMAEAFAIKERLPENSKKIFEVIKQYYEEPEKMIRQGTVVLQPEGLLRQDILNSMDSSPETKDFTVYGQAGSGAISAEGDIAFIYNDGAVFNDAAPAFMDAKNAAKNRTVLRRTNSVTKSSMNRTVRGASVYQNEINGTVEKQRQFEENLQRQVKNMIDGRIASISEKVYTKLEKRLANERKRRGY